MAVRPQGNQILLSGKSLIGKCCHNDTAELAGLIEASDFVMTSRSIIIKEHHLQNEKDKQVLSKIIELAYRNSKSNNADEDIHE